jgi:pyridoxal phosphate enzyme (YggS family)
MAIDISAWKHILDALTPYGATLVAVSKLQPAEAVRQLYDLGQRDFGENYVQELLEKQAALPKDIRWHFIGHLQSNKVRHIAPFIHLIHGTDSASLLKEINKQGIKNNRTISCLLQVRIAREETKFGMTVADAEALLNGGFIASLDRVSLQGFMGMATLSDDPAILHDEFRSLKSFSDRMCSLPASPVQGKILSMGMTSDFSIALEEGSTMVRIGSAIFGERPAKS